MAATAATWPRRRQLSGSTYHAERPSIPLTRCSGVSKAWTGLIRVDGTTYTWMGLPSPGCEPATQTAFSYTSSKSVFTFNVGGHVTLTVTFTSPLTPNDMKRMSLVFSYLDVSVVSADGKRHDVQLYADITGEWASGDPSAEIEWTFGTTSGGNVYHKVYRETQLLWSETNDQAEWGYWYWATKGGYSLSYQSGSNTTVREQFAKTGQLSNHEDSRFRAINDSFPTFAFAQDLSRVGTTAVDTLFTVGLEQEQAIQFDGAQGNVSVPSLWLSYFSDANDAVSCARIRLPRAPLTKWHSSISTMATTTRFRA